MLLLIVCGAVALWQWLRAASRLRRLVVLAVQEALAVAIMSALMLQMEPVAALAVMLLLIVCGAVVLQQ